LQYCGIAEKTGRIHFKGRPSSNKSAALQDSKYLLDAVTSPGITFDGKQKIGVTLNFNKQSVIDFTKFSKLAMCRPQGLRNLKKLVLSKIKQEKFGPTIKIRYCKMSEKHVRSTQISGLWLNQIYF
jgi:hypothetical protein